MRMLRKHPLVSYVLGTYAWTWIFWIYLIFCSLPPQGLVRKGIFVLGLSGPLVAAAGISWMLGGKTELRVLVGRLWIWRVSGVYFVLALILPPLLLIIGAGLHPGARSYLLSLAPASLLVVIPMFCWLLVRSGPVNEEFGWRGYLLPALLKRYTPFAASCILGPIWAVWHWPLWFIIGVPHGHWPFFLFAIMVIPMTFLFTWFYLHTKGSLLIAILFHGSLNISIKMIPILPPHYPNLTPFVLWILASTIATGILIYLNRAVWFGRQEPLQSGVLKPSENTSSPPQPSTFRIGIEPHNMR